MKILQLSSPRKTFHNNPIRYIYRILYMHIIYIYMGVGVCVCVCVCVCVGVCVRYFFYSSVYMGPLSLPY